MKVTTAVRNDMISLIRARAREAGVPPALALATAEVESGFDPTANGDMKWHEKDGGAKYIRFVRDNPAFADNPARTDAAAWHSYGMFQLLAPFFVQPDEHPRVLYDPNTNTVRAMRILHRLWDAYHDPAKVRIHYGAGNLNVSEATKGQLLERFIPAYERWAAEDGGDGGNDGGGGTPTPRSSNGMLLAGLAVVLFYFMTRR